MKIKTKPSKVLLNFKKKWIRDILVKRNKRTRQPIAYCVIGALGCSAGLITLEDTPSEAAILSAYLNKRVMNKQYLCPAKRCKNGWDFEKDVAGHDEGSLVHIIVHLNDDHKWGFKQVGNWLKSLGL